MLPQCTTWKTQKFCVFKVNFKVKSVHGYTENVLLRKKNIYCFALNKHTLKEEKWLQCTQIKRKLHVWLCSTSWLIMWYSDPSWEVVRASTALVAPCLLNQKPALTGALLHQHEEVCMCVCACVGFHERQLFMFLYFWDMWLQLILRGGVSAKTVIFWRNLTWWMHFKPISVTTIIQLAALRCVCLATRERRDRKRALIPDTYLSLFSS